MPNENNPGRVVMRRADGKPMFPSQLLRQYLGGRHAGEAAAEDHDAFAHLRLRMPPIFPWQADGPSSRNSMQRLAS